MDYYGSDRKLSELGDQDLDDFLEQDMFTPPTTLSNDPSMDHFGLDNSPLDPTDNEWLDNFFDDPVLNDRMMTDALQPRRVQSEHSYSLTNGEKITIDGQIKLEPTEKGSDFEDFLSNAINPNMTLTDVSMVTTSQCMTQATNATSHNIINTSTELICPTLNLSLHNADNSQRSDTCELAMAVNSIVSQPSITTVTRTSSHPQTLLKQPTIILATQQQSTPEFSLEQCFKNAEPLLAPTVNIKVEPMDSISNLSSPEHTTMYDSIGLPPTPPSSSNSDSDGSLSPQRSAPPSPIRHSHQLLRQHVHTQHTLGGASAVLSQPLFTSPIPTSGMLLLSDEEKRTLISEGYPIPHKLPLTKQEEKNLKKIRRKIKNKISAQESRRKKKEYLETLEKKVESYNSENSDLKKKVESLENNNRTLIGQLHKLQAIVAKVPRPSTPSTQTGTCLMVLVLFFAVFVGTWSPFTWSIGYSSLQPAITVQGPVISTPVIEAPIGPAMGPEQPMDPYSTPNMRSRLLLSTKEENEEPYGPHPPFSYHDFFMQWLTNAQSCLGAQTNSEMDFSISAPVPDILGDKSLEVADPVVAQNMAHNITARVMTPQINTTA